MCKYGGGGDFAGGLDMGVYASMVSLEVKQGEGINLVQSRRWGVGYNIYLTKTLVLPIH